MQRWTLRSMPWQLCEADAVPGQLMCSPVERSVIATVFEDARHAGAARGGNTRMGHSVASVAVPGRTIEQVDFALIGHQESWKAAADVLAVLRGPEHTPLPDDEIRDILPWIPPRAVCHVEIGSIVSTNIGAPKFKPHTLYITSSIPPHRLQPPPFPS